MAGKTKEERLEEQWEEEYETDEGELPERGRQGVLHSRRG
jgi:hypothetical protein